MQSLSGTATTRRLSMMKENDGLFMQRFGEIEDPRMNRQRRHALLDIIAITMCASIAGADGWTRVASFGRSKEAWLRTFLTLPNGIPSHDTFGPVFSILESQAFQQAFQSWVCAIQERVQGVAPIDGKTARRSHDHAREKKAIHVVSAWATECSMALGEVKVDEKSNEITAIPELVRALKLTGCLVTIDAMGCQREIAQSARARWGTETACTGCLTWPSTRISTEYGSGTPPKTCSLSEKSPSTFSKSTNPRRAASRQSACRLDGMTATSKNS
jgi:hypothetical protein